MLAAQRSAYVSFANCLVYITVTVIVTQCQYTGAGSLRQNVIIRVIVDHDRGNAFYDLTTDLQSLSNTFNYPMHSVSD